MLNNENVRKDVDYHGRADDRARESRVHAALCLEQGLGILALAALRLYALYLIAAVVEVQAVEAECRHQLQRDVYEQDNGQERDACESLGAAADGRVGLSAKRRAEP